MNKINSKNNNLENNLNKFAELAVRSGANLQKGDILLLSSPSECYEFTRLVVQEAYKAGAKEVVVDWSDDIVNREKFMNSPEEIFETFPQWKTDFYEYYSSQGACTISIFATDPTLYKDVEPKRLAKYNKVRREAIKKFSDRMMKNENRWSIISVPTPSWAKKVFPNDSEEIAVEKLWEAIFSVTRVSDENPIESWNEHRKNISAKVESLNKNRFKSLHYKNSIGTDVVVELVENHIWIGCGDVDVKGIPFYPNMPTEEIFSMPKKTGVNGIIVSSMPLIYNGSILDKFKLVFKDGKIIDYSAETGYEILKGLLDTDDGSKYLGEIALVPHNSPISNRNIIFYNTLFDENASCHFALGEAYPSCVESGEKMSDDEKEKAGVNKSLNHVDFMVGTKDLSIIGETFDGEKIVIFKDGNWEI
ncbi:MAG: aminopeptidase [Fusobacteriaceae bacterium]